VAQWRNGVTPTGRAKARDYEDSVYHVIIKACRDYEARIGGVYEWPQLDQQIAWAQEAWKNACEVVKEEYELTDRILALVSFSITPSTQVLTSHYTDPATRFPCSWRADQRNPPQNCNHLWLRPQ
jgi:hypothetical protein